MQEPSTRSRRPHRVRRLLLLAAITGAVVASDQASKRWAEQHARYRSVELMPGIMLRCVRNPGGAWGIFASVREEVRRPFLVAISLLAIAVILVSHSRTREQHGFVRLAFALVFGGATGNLVDRAAHGYVVDFVDISAPLFGRVRHWPTFNVADIAITLGLVLLATMLLWPRSTARVRAVTDGAPPSPR
jgi:signal peptidase II